MTSFKRLAGLAVAIVGVGVGAVVGAPTQRPRPAGQSVDSASEERAAQGGQKARARADRKSRPHGLSLAELAEPYGEEVSVEEQLASDQARARANARANARMVDLETRFANESADVRWAAPFSAHLRASLDEEGVDPAAVRRVECRSTLCRVELDLGDGAPVAALLRVSAQLETPYWVRPVAAPAAALDVFVARPGSQVRDFGAPGI